MSGSQRSGRKTGSSPLVRGGSGSQQNDAGVPRGARKPLPTEGVAEQVGGPVAARLSVAVAIAVALGVGAIIAAT